jgi:hypothetical protein
VGAVGYRYPYWMSIAFGATCIILACFLTDIRKLMTMSVEYGAGADVVRETGTIAAETEKESEQRVEDKV